MVLSLTLVEFAIKTLSSGDVSAIFKILGKVNATVKNLKGGFYSYPICTLAHASKLDILGRTGPKVLQNKERTEWISPKLLWKDVRF